MAHVKYYNAVEAAEKEYQQYKRDFKRGVCGYFESQGAPKEKLAEILQGVVKVYNGTPVENLFSERHYGRVRVFAMQYETIEKLEHKLDLAKASLEAALQNDARDLHEA